MKFSGFLLISILLVFTACPRPDYPLQFRSNDEWRNSLTFEEGPVKLKISGKHVVTGWPDNLFIEVIIEGLDTNEIVFFDTTNFMGRPVNITKYFDDKITFESESFRLFRMDTYIKKHKVDVVLNANLNMHEQYSHLTREEFMDYLDTLKAQIRIENIFNESKLIKVKVDKELLIKKMGKWVPALQENG